MAYKRLANRDTTTVSKSLEDGLYGSFMGVGTHLCKIKEINTRAIGNDDTVNSINVLFENSFGEIHRENIFFWSMRTEDISFSLKKLLAAAVTDPAELIEIADSMNDFEWTILDKIVGRTIRITIDKTDGYTIVRAPTEYKAILDGRTVGSNKCMNTLKKNMENQGIERSYFKITEFNREKKPNENKKKHNFFDSCPTDDRAKKPDSSVGNVDTTRRGQIPASKKFF